MIIMMRILSKKKKKVIVSTVVIHDNYEQPILKNYACCRDRPIREHFDKLEE